MTHISRTRFLTGPLAVFDLCLGATAIFFPGFYMSIMHFHGSAQHYYMLQRTGVLWLFFALCQGLSFVFAEKIPVLVFLVGMLRLMEVPADPVYLLTSRDLTLFGKFALMFAPVFNLFAGSFLIYAWKNNRSTVT